MVFSVFSDTVICSVLTKCTFRHGAAASSPRIRCCGSSRPCSAARLPQYRQFHWPSGSRRNGNSSKAAAAGPARGASARLSGVPQPLLPPHRWLWAALPSRSLCPPPGRWIRRIHVPGRMLLLCHSGTEERNGSRAQLLGQFWALLG